MREQHSPVIIFTTYQIKVSAEQNNISFERVKAHLEQSQIRFKEVFNMHLGLNEPSLVISAEHEDLVADICRRSNQELYLILDQDRNASIVNPQSNQRRNVGVFKGVEPRYDGDKVFDPTTGIHYAII